jgi:ATP-dependent Lon protease
MRIRTAHFPAVKTLEDFNLDHLPSLRRDVLAHLATGTFVPKAENVILLGPPGIGKTHLAIGLGVRPESAISRWMIFARGGVILFCSGFGGWAARRPECRLGCRGSG